VRIVAPGVTRAEGAGGAVGAAIRGGIEDKSGEAAACAMRRAPKIPMTAIAIVRILSVNLANRPITFRTLLSSGSA
jgi:hypothetical protein